MTGLPLTLVLLLTPWLALGIALNVKRNLQKRKRLNARVAQCLTLSA